MYAPTVNNFIIIIIKIIKIIIIIIIIINIEFRVLGKEER